MSAAPASLLPGHPRSAKPPTKHSVAGLVAIALLALGASAAVQIKIDSGIAPYRNTPEVLWVSSGKTVKKLSLGFEGLLADIYWTRAVQFYGGQRRDRKSDFALLYPLLDITTDLDPQLLIAYKFGAVFLAEASPRGAGNAQQAVQLMRKGIQANPDYWRFWGDLGFIYYQDLKDYPAASAAYLEGSKNPQAAPWMKVMAAVIAQKGGNRETSRFLWTDVYQNNEDELIRENALAHLQGLKAGEEIERLDKLIDDFREKTGRQPKSFSELVAEGLLGGIPADPLGLPYRIGPDGKAALDPREENKIRLE